MGALNSHTIADYITSLEAQVKAIEKELKRERNQSKINLIDKQVIEQLKDENGALKTMLKRYENNTKTRYRYVSYVQYAGRLMKVGEYKTPEEAQLAEKRALEAL